MLINIFWDSSITNDPFAMPLHRPESRLPRAREQQVVSCATTIKRSSKSRGGNRVEGRELGDMTAWFTKRAILLTFLLSFVKLHKHYSLV